MIVVSAAFWIKQSIARHAADFRQRQQSRSVLGDRRELVLGCGQSRFEQLQSFARGLLDVNVEKAIRFLKSRRYGRSARRIIANLLAAVTL